MEPQGSLQHSQYPATCPYLEPTQSSPCPHPTSWKSILILSSQLHLGLPTGLFPSDFHTKTLYMSLLFLIRATFPAHHNLLDFITRTILGEECRTLSSSLCSLLHSPVTSSLSGPNILLSTLFSNTLSMSSFFNVSDQVAHPYEREGIIIVLYILNFIFFDSKPEDKGSAPNESKHFVISVCSYFLHE